MEHNHNKHPSKYDITCHFDKFKCEMITQVNVLSGDVCTYMVIQNGQMKICYTRVSDCNAID